ncbi:MAG: ATP-binding protein [Saprospirales bacterium]|nr:ATP-binding protein [Saprospirales bacterium]
MYGANGAGKSNLINALDLLRGFVTQGNLPIEFLTETFRLDEESRKKDVYLGIEFLKDSVPYYYGLTLNQGIVIEEELQISGLGSKEDITLFSRKDSANKHQLSLSFNEEVMLDKEASLFPSFLKNEVLERNKPVLYFMRNRQNAVFEQYKKAFDWFSKDLVTILPTTKPGGLALRLEQDSRFYEFASEIMQTFNTGIQSIRVETIPIEDFFGEDDKEEAARITAELKADPERVRAIRNPYEEILFVWKDEKAYAKRMFFFHQEDGGINRFSLAEESDGTRRLLDYLPALYSVIHSPKVYLIDEIERSIHPLLIKELARKFSHNESTSGQLIFTTHESILLDQDIFRPDEIWFAEKKKDGATEIHALSEFKEHHTIDIRKGYLNGRYGAIPFLGNLKDLKWEEYAEAH